MIIPSHGWFMALSREAFIFGDDRNGEIPFWKPRPIGAGICTPTWLGDVGQGQMLVHTPAPWVAYGLVWIREKWVVTG